MRSLTSITHRTLSQEAYLVLKECILNLELAPGAEIDEGQIAATLGASKTPIRAAIARLEGEGLIVSRPGRKSYVANISPRTIHEIFQVRSTLESAVLHATALEMTVDDLEYIRTILDETKLALTNGNLSEFTNLNQRFHAYLIHRSDNSYLKDLINTLLDQTHRAASAVLRSEQPDVQFILTQQTMQRHTSIYEAIVDRDADRAAGLLRYDIEIVLEVIDMPEVKSSLQELSILT